ncbi:MAG: hypothetical protein ABIH11_07495 [Candidatus Altiarchaeota archaeon]
MKSILLCILAVGLACACISSQDIGVTGSKPSVTYPEIPLMTTTTSTSTTVATVEPTTTTLKEIDESKTVVKKSVIQGLLATDRLTPDETCVLLEDKVWEEHPELVCELAYSRRMRVSDPDVNDECVGGVGTEGCVSCTFECDKNPKVAYYMSVGDLFVRRAYNTDVTIYGTVYPLYGQSLQISSGLNTLDVEYSGLVPLSGIGAGDHVLAKGQLMQREGSSPVFQAYSIQKY